jgi:hypothetical protein
MLNLRLRQRCWGASRQASTLSAAEQPSEGVYVLPGWTAGWTAGLFVPSMLVGASGKNAERAAGRDWKRRERELPETPALLERRDRKRAADRERQRRLREEAREPPEAE